MTNQNKTITDEQADESIKSLSAGPVVRADEFFKAREAGEINDNGVSHKSKSKSVDETEITILRIIVEHPMRPSSQYPKLAGISPNTFKKIRPILKDKGFIDEHKLQANARGRSAILLGPTEQGKKYLSDYDNNKRNG
jgi:hypothetical protein